MTRIGGILLAVLILSMGPFFCSKNKKPPSISYQSQSTLREPPPNMFPPPGDSEDLANASAYIESTYTRKIGPVSIGRDNLMSVYVHITRVRLDSTKEWRDSDISFAIFDSLNRELYRRKSGTRLGGAQTDFDCYQFSIPTIGSTIACCCSIAPSYGPHGEDTQLLGLDSNNKVVPYTTILPQGPLNVVFLDSRNTVEPTFVDQNYPYALPAVEVQYSINSFEVKGYFRIYPNGFIDDKQPAVFDFQKIPVIVDTLDAHKARQRSHRANLTVLLYNKPNGETTNANRVPLSLNSRIRFLDAAYLGDWWIRVVIDGHEGYMSSRDFEVLGLPELD